MGEGQEQLVSGSSSFIFTSGADLQCGTGCPGAPKQLDGEGRKGGSEQQVKDKAHVTLYIQQLANYSLEEVLPC